MSQGLKKDVEKSLVVMCNRIGFKKKQYYFIKPIDNNVMATLHFGITTQSIKMHIYVNLTIGVSHRKIEELYAKLTGNDNGLIQSTIGLQIGYLMPGNSFKEWEFTENRDNAPIYEDMLKQIQMYGLPFQEKMKDFNNLFEAIDKREPGILNQARDRYLPILYYLKGDKQKGLETIEAAISRQQTPLTDKEIKKTSSGETVVLRADSDKKVGAEVMDNLLRNFPSGGSIVIIGSGIGKLDPEYLKFAERYRAL